MLLTNACLCYVLNNNSTSAQAALILLLQKNQKILTRAENGFLQTLWDKCGAGLVLTYYYFKAGNNNLNKRSWVTSCSKKPSCFVYFLFAASFSSLITGSLMKTFSRTFASICSIITLYISTGYSVPFYSSAIFQQHYFTFHVLLQLLWEAAISEAIKSLRVFQMIFFWWYISAYVMKQVQNWSWPRDNDALYIAIPSHLPPTTFWLNT